ncbi:hypothetical protein KAR91_49775 [Candidatus Pacearchaeota archaeon]|nr:hypothetical protein [Candidatus Pacearchaeota archaeon]
MGRRPIYGDENNKEIKRLYVEENLSLNAIGQKFNGMHPQIVKRKLGKMGVAIRDKSAAMKLHHEQKKGQAVGDTQSNEQGSKG